MRKRRNYIIFKQTIEGIQNKVLVRAGKKPISYSQLLHIAKYFLN